MTVARQPMARRVAPARGIRVPASLAGRIRLPDGLIRIAGPSVRRALPVAARLATSLGLPANRAAWDRILGRRGLVAGAAVVLLLVSAVPSLLGAFAAPGTPGLTSVAPVASPAVAAGGSTDGILGIEGAGADATSQGPDPIDLAGKGLLVGGLLIVTLRVLRRIQSTPATAGSQLIVLESRPLAPKATLHLVAIGDRRLVVGLTPSGMVALADFGDEPASLTIADPAPAAAERRAPVRPARTLRTGRATATGSALAGQLGGLPDPGATR